MYDDVEQKKKKEKKHEPETVEVTKENATETKKVIGLKADWVSILVKFFVFLLVAFLFIFIITKLRNWGNQNTFSNNIEKMREAAYLYFKEENHRPILDNESVRITLGDMIEAKLITELKENKTVCSQDYSYVDLTKKEQNHYDMNVYLTCGGEAKEGNFDVTYKDGSAIATTTLYELKRTVKNKNQYSCPSGYILDGKRCLGKESVVTVSANPIYRIIPRTEFSADYKAPMYSYEYVNPIQTTSEESYHCSSGYELYYDKCVKKGKVYSKTVTSYDCPKGSVLEGSLCVYKTSATYNDEIAYCSKGSLINGHECYVKKPYMVRCSHGSYDSLSKSCYTTYSASKELSDWMFDGKVTYSSRTKLKDTDKIRYEYDYEKENGSIVYRKYIRKYLSKCDVGDELFGHICRHYDASYIEKYCSSNYHLNSSQTECYTLTEARYKNSVGVYSCPDGYKRSGSGASSYCYKYEKGTKKTSQEKYCLSGYDLTSENECVKTIEAIKNDQTIVYSCPAGYESKGKGSQMTCYKKTASEAYYYCRDSSLKLEGNVCVRSEKTIFRGYYCPKGYTLSGSTCFKTVRDDSILATKNTSDTSETEIIWSKEKDLDGWTWTGKTKQETE